MPWGAQNYQPDKVLKEQEHSDKVTGSSLGWFSCFSLVNAESMEVIMTKVLKFYEVTEWLKRAIVFQRKNKSGKNWESDGLTQRAGKNHFLW